MNISAYFCKKIRKKDTGDRVKWLPVEVAGNGVEGSRVGVWLSMEL